MGKRQAILIGCNYPGTNAELKGCINDVYAMRDMLTKYMGFQPNEITLMLDTDKSTTLPNGRNIKAALTAMVQSAGDGDVLVVHFSGHGTQVPTSDPKEKDGKDEAICPADLNVMTDNDLRAIFMPLKNKSNVKLTFVADCCHSGTLLDHDAVVITGPKAGGPPPPNVDIQALQSMLASLGGGKKEMDGELLKNRALPYADLCNMVMGLLGHVMGGGAGADGAKAGGAAGALGQADFHQMMLSLFKDDAPAGSAKNSQLMSMLTMGAGMLMSSGILGNKPGAGSPQAAHAGAAAPTPTAEGGLLAGLLGMCFGGGGSATTGHAETYAAPPEAPASQQQVPPPPPGQQSNEELPSDVGILITGCQDKETSADARPPGGPAHGALTNALVTVVQSHHESNPSYPLTYRNLVIGVREALAKTGFAQNPCLECGPKWSDSPFIVHA